MRLFTWHDVETELQKSWERWPESWNRVDVYNSEVVINVKEAIDEESQNEKILKEIFHRNYRDGKIYVEFDETELDVVYEEGEEEDRQIRAESPLFKDFYVNDPKKVETELAVPMMVFDSYKGGVGRTLSLIALTREIAEIYGDKKKVLVIDADLEAPGLTWMLKESTENAPISYLDVLSLMHLKKMDQELAEKIARSIKKINFTVETKTLEVEEYFLPVYREMEQTWNIYSTPEKIIAIQNNKYIITEFLSEIGAALGVDLILVDLRAGITEFSAPFLLDPRVQKYFVSSTSMQSVKGTNLILNKLYEKVPMALDNSKILLNMIPNEMEEDTLHHIEEEFSAFMEKGAEGALSSQEDYLVRIFFESPFIYLGGFQEICNLLKGKNLSKVMNGIAKSLFEQKEKAVLNAEEIKTVLEKIYRLAEKEVTAEGNESSNMLSTGSIREIAKDYSDAIPQMVVLGAKGSGKTYIYKQLLAKQTWGNFLESINGQSENCLNQAFILPLLSSINSRNLNKLLQGCIERVNREFGELNLSASAVNENYNKVVEYSRNLHNSIEWLEFWKNLMCSMLGETFESLEELDQFLEEENKQIIFVVDGLEDLVMVQPKQEEESWKNAVRILLQNMVNELRNLPKGKVGLVVFARRDIAEEAISINFEQFKNQYQRYELVWTPTEALRLALWIVSQAEPEIFGKDIDILKASRQILEEKLELLWGKKLGKRDSREAVTARWIIAALSDFTGQLQARDIVRFLKYATETYREVNIGYFDRYIMPAEIKNTISKCSKEKYGEIESEMKNIYLILKKFEDMDVAEKQLPLTLDKLSLTGEEIAKLEGQGYLSSVDKKYYFPEIIRYALGFKYAKGARPRVLSLLVK